MRGVGKRQASTQSRLLGRYWRLPTGTHVKVIRPSARALANLDQEWAVLRTPCDVAADWRWVGAAKDRDLFLVREEPGGEPVALWRSSRPVVQLGGRRINRLDNIEVHPERRGQGLGRLAMALVALRATELRCVGVVLASPGENEQWCRSLGAVDAKPLGWDWPRGLLGFWFHQAELKELEEVAHALEVEEGS
jgi:GNAT superfamily N-acetyltransferase